MILRIFLSTLFISSAAFATETEWQSVGVFETDEQEPQQVEVLQSQEGLLLKKRGPKSENKEEPQTPKNLPNRQSIFELGVGMGYMHAPSKALLYRRNGVAREFGEAFNGGPTAYSHGSGAIDLNFGVHPPFQKLARNTFGINFQANTAVAPYDKVGAAPGLMNYEVGFIGALKHNWMAYADYDLVYIPWFDSNSVFAVGYFLGQRQAGFDSGKENSSAPNDYVEGDYEKQQGLRLQYRIIHAESWTKKSYMSTAAVFSYSTKGVWRLMGVWNWSFGKKNAPKEIIQK